MDALDIDPEPVSGTGLSRPVMASLPCEFDHNATNSGVDSPLTAAVKQSTTPQIIAALPQRHTDNITHLSPTTLESPASRPSIPPTNNTRPESLVVTGTSTQGMSTTAPDDHLTPEEAEFLHSLYSRNVPHGEIIDMMRVLREKRSASTAMEGPSNQAIDEEPPAYRVES
jgi:hypothetical protein